VCRLESFRAIIEELTTASTTAGDAVPAGPYPSYVVPLHHAYLCWRNRKDRREALALLKQACVDFPRAIPVQREYALLLTGAGRADEASRVLEGIAGRRDDVREALTSECRMFGDFETLCRIGAAYKNLGDEAGKSSPGMDPAGPAHQHYRAALSYYADAFEFSKDHFPGGNAAVLALLIGDTNRARAIAREVAALCRQVLPSDLSPDARHWLFSTEATMALILEDPQNAVHFQKEALDALAAISASYIQTSYNQLCRLWHVLDHGHVQQVIGVIQAHPIWAQLRAGPCGNCGVTRLNQAFLDLIEPETWRHYRKTKPIWARQLEQPQLVDTREGPVQANAGDYLCRGIAGELWPQKATKLNSTYDPTQNVDADGWREYQPSGDSEGVYAVSVDKPFSVTATFGTLHGKPGDYVVKHAADRLTAYPEDIWIVGRAVFDSTYEVVS
jgi:tetratricopeptide (TPR) repeat protein